MEGMILIIIVVCVIGAVAIRAKAWERWIDKHTSEKE